MEPSANKVSHLSLLHIEEHLAGSRGWFFVLTMLALFLLPFFLTHRALNELGNYDALSLIPVSCAAFLFGRRGALVMSGIIFISAMSLNSGEYGLHWPVETMQSLIFGTVGLLILGLVIGQLRHLGMTIRQKNIELQQANSEIQKQAHTDPLTGLPNRYALLTKIEDELAVANAEARRPLLIFFDVDHFKSINDTYGHHTGDVVLQHVGRCAQQIVSATGIIGRYGGEEFIVILPQATPAEGLALAEHLRGAIAKAPITFADLTVSLAVTVSIGVACYPLDGDTLAALIEKADQAMYLAKQSGRNRVCVTASLHDVVTAQWPDNRFDVGDLPLAS